MKKEAKPAKQDAPKAFAGNVLLDDIRTLIEETRVRVATSVNSALTVLYWRVGKRISEEILKGERADYGKEVLPTLSAELIRDHGRGWSERNLAYMVRFAQAFPDTDILQALCAKLSWSHFKQIIYIDDPLKRDFYAEMCRVEGWSTRTLEKKIGSMLFERTALSRKPEKLARAELEALREEDRLSPDLVFRDPYFLEFLGLADSYPEKDLEAAILREMERFLLELGNGFAFLARQKRIQLDNDDYYIDLLFYHRGLNRLIAIDLKIGDFKAEYKGQMELYLRWLDKHERRRHEDEPLGIILCAGKKREMVELLELGRSGIHVAEYLTELPPREILQQKLHAAIELSRKRLENREA
ncbi:PDDEXK nuclease domain-containing protein [Geoalkalibacter halelectricus]|uniref:PDDEXK nuclease domain-containing protein n=1 Tax=Geoalkalibacter halelectricus TaxID=2847045 RepID=A0ABY5ZHW4_9BACT|nr:PDDEXK nuclease domain-containing protein [Geoalkalibacter halelectricus]MDO3376545.1 PDDEXK nuclease domain-containing protein [Geoalkalibacter halelectricus]UWZ78489.1 PDDEXK nuclease domain-containing protein [Geoalkalibacter halelectricus]